jgi:predicted HicB family RNase H-like nuclease
MKDTMTYKGYAGSVHYNDEDRVLYGKLECIRSLISYEGTDVDSLRCAFEEAVDDYLALCKKAGRKPEQPFSGTFNVRTGSDLHRRAALLAEAQGTTLNRVVSEALQRYLQQEHEALYGVRAVDVERQDGMRLGDWLRCRAASLTPTLSQREREEVGRDLSRPDGSAR